MKLRLSKKIEKLGQTVKGNCYNPSQYRRALERNARYASRLRTFRDKARFLIECGWQNMQWGLTVTTEESK